MKESDWRYSVDVILFICLGGMTLIGILLGFVIPTGPAAADSAKYFLGLHRHQWGNIHAWLSIAFVALMVVHIVLNWNWVTAKTRQVFKRRSASALAVTACAPFLVLFLFWVGTPKDSYNDNEYRLESGERGPVQGTAASGIPPAARAASGSQGALGGGESPALGVDKGAASKPEHSPAVGGLVITGRLTLLDIERATGLSGRAIAEELKLPSTAALNEPLGRLRQRYGFEIQAVRDTVERLLRE